LPIDIAELSALAQVVVVDLVLAGDNAIIVGLVAASLPREQRARVILIGILAATALRIVFAIVTTQLLQIIGLTLAGGLLLLWVCWRMFRELRRPRAHAAQTGHTKTLRQSLTEIIVADLSMSLDNVLAVAGAAHGSTWVLAVGLLLSVVLMGIAANLVAHLLESRRWIAWIGLTIVLYVAVSMVWHGAFDVAEAVRN
jgi:YjbE family integral membrane protein